MDPLKRTVMISLQVFAHLNKLLNKHLIGALFDEEHVESLYFNMTFDQFLYHSRISIEYDDCGVILCFVLMVYTITIATNITLIFFSDSKHWMK